MLLSKITAESPNNNVLNLENENNILKKEGVNNGQTYQPTDEFRRIQEESKRELDKPIRERASTVNNEELRKRLSTDLQRELERRGYHSGNSNELILTSDKGTSFNLYKDVDAKTFHDFFEISKTYTNNSELVDLHDLQDYESTTNYLSNNGMSGFAITSDGDLISVFNADTSKQGFLSAIASIVKRDAKTLDCYNSKLQPLTEMYKKKFGFKVASIMDYNIEYDHDNIAVNHNMPKVAFMVNTNQEVTTKHFNKDQYDEAKNYPNTIQENERLIKLYSDDFQELLDWKLTIPQAVGVIRSGLY